MSIPVNINECSLEQLLHLPMIGDKKAHNILERRKTCPLTQESFLELIQRSDLGPLEGRVSFNITSPEELRSHHPQQVHMQRPMDLCDMRNASYDETQVKRPLGARSDRSGLENQRSSRDDSISIRKMMMSPPKALLYSGDSDWDSFERKYRSFCREFGMSLKDSTEYLCWVLTGKASDFYNLMLRQDSEIGFERLMVRLGDRFGLKDLRETAFLKFQGAEQGGVEKLEEWAERITYLSTRAFGGDHHRFQSEQMISKFCLGCQDKEAGLFVANQRPESMSAAIRLIMQYQYNHQAVYSRNSHEPTVRQTGSSSDYRERSDPSPRRSSSRQDHWRRSPERRDRVDRTWQSPSRVDRDSGARFNRYRSPSRDRDLFQERRPQVSREPSPYTGQRYSESRSHGGLDHDRLEELFTLVTTMNRRFDGIEGAVADLSSKVDSLNVRVGRMETRMVSTRQSSSSPRRMTCFKCDSPDH